MQLTVSSKTTIGRRRQFLEFFLHSFQFISIGGTRYQNNLFRYEHFSKDIRSLYNLSIQFRLGYYTSLPLLPGNMALHCCPFFLFFCITIQHSKNLIAHCRNVRGQLGQVSYIVLIRFKILTFQLCRYPVKFENFHCKIVQMAALQKLLISIQTL